jgi:hypothetical protein
MTRHDSLTTPSRSQLRQWDAAVMAAISAVMFLATALGWWSFSFIEVAGFVTGGVCVWLAVREHVATWPIGLANNVIFFFCFGKDACLPRRRPGAAAQFHPVRHCGLADSTCTCQLIDKQAGFAKPSELGQISTKRLKVCHALCYGVRMIIFQRGRLTRRRVSHLRITLVTSAVSFCVPLSSFCLLSQLLRTVESPDRQRR